MLKTQEGQKTQNIFAHQVQKPTLITEVIDDI